MGRVESSSITSHSAEFFVPQATRWRCPRHMIACQCSPVLDTAEQLPPIISAQWESESDRRAVLTKLADVGVKSVTALKRVIATPVFDAKIPSTCWFR
jgi:hypothetical protein